MPGGCGNHPGRENAPALLRSYLSQKLDNVEVAATSCSNYCLRRTPLERKSTDDEKNITAVEAPVRVLRPVLLAPSLPICYRKRPEFNKMLQICRSNTIPIFRGSQTAELAVSDERGGGGHRSAVQTGAQGTRLRKPIQGNQNQTKPTSWRFLSRYSTTPRWPASAARSTAAVLALAPRSLSQKSACSCPWPATSSRLARDARQRPEACSQRTAYPFIE